MKPPRRYDDHQREQGRHQCHRMTKHVIRCEEPPHHRSQCQQQEAGCQAINRRKCGHCTGADTRDDKRKEDLVHHAVRREKE